MPSDFFSLLGAMTSGPAPVIAKDAAPNGVEVSTVNTPDMGPETALIVRNVVHPVERYEDEETARIGHAKWLTFASTLKPGDKLNELGYGELVDDEEVDFSQENADAE